MTAVEVNEQIKIIRKAGKAATKSQSSAMKFLIAAGIIKKTASRPITTKKGPTKTPN